MSESIDKKRRSRSYCKSEVIRDDRTRNAIVRDSKSATPNADKVIRPM